jgi:hypothetical protein
MRNLVRMRRHVDTIAAMLVQTAWRTQIGGVGTDVVFDEWVKMRKLVREELAYEGAKS